MMTRFAGERRNVGGGAVGLDPGLDGRMVLEGYAGRSKPRPTKAAGSELRCFDADLAAWGAAILQFLGANTCT
jgi:hypothetical protein